MKSPKPLKKGDSIGIISTARKISKEEIEPAITLLESWGLKVKLGDHLFDEFHQFAGTTLARNEDLQNMLDDDSVQAILCARGGYGTVQIIDSINFSKFLQNPKWIAGYSDVTVLHSQCHVYGVETIHSTMPINFPTDGSSNESTESLRKALFGEPLHYEFTVDENSHEGIAERIIVGGNLSILYSLLGSRSAINTDGKILFIEDLDEYLYHIDRMMMNMKRNNMFQNVRGLIVGGFSEMKDNTVPYGFDSTQIISSYVDHRQKMPVWFGFPAGHITNNYAIILGRKVRIEVKNGIGKFSQV